MHPLICKIGPFSIYSYGLMMALAVLVCSFLMARDARKHGLTDEWVWDFVFSFMLGGILGARLLFILLNLSYFIDNPIEIVMLHHGGLSFQGGLFGGAIAGLLYVKVKKLSFVKTADLLAPYLALGHAIGRVGCFLNGCCYGKHWDHGIFFPVHQDTLHPTQLYAAAGLFFIFVLLKIYQKKQFATGNIFVVYLLLAAGLRFIVEFFRADHEILFFGALSIFQVFCLLIIGIAIYVKLLINRHQRTGRNEA